MKILLTLFLIGLGFTANAGEICASWKPELKDRRDESRYSKENYLKALKGLNFYAENKGVDPWELLTVVEGYLLKEKAVEEKRQSNEKHSYKAYCEFIVQQGVHRG